ncbi:hypothetical protein KC887_02100 [Candidatus Kaiserbacteria bacterium]|nr:hypothetical protein [Candidatus Kaiserbacteria bacterium]
MSHKNLVLSAQLLAQLIEKQAKAVATQDAKRQMIVALRKEMADATAHMGDEGYRDIVKIGQDLKRINAQIDRDVEAIEDFSVTVHEQVSLVQEHLNAIKDTLFAQAQEDTQEAA